jgi:hypothetical protein
VSFLKLFKKECGLTSTGIGFSAVNLFLPGTERNKTVHRSKGKIIPTHVRKM